ncbi:glyoxalase superfamily protein [Rufibacter sediminis]|uniref:VOC family protein n=1 Tax=Rufibacter sediminis TaxID=2762756 RepID=A0ABR6VVR2_9BACT|nr:glyoxalase superfamily protein [Rufibacter sediminis]MBC3540908.1 VOC family protein [Rufibacter sediminis]
MAIARPIFRIFDYQKATEFYIDWLGFRVENEHRFGDNFPVYLQISRGDLKLHLSEHHGDCSPGARIHIEDFTGLEEYHQKLTAKDYRYNKPSLQKAFWNPNVICMEVIDPFGNRMTFTEELSQEPAQNELA